MDSQDGRGGGGGGGGAAITSPTAPTPPAQPQPPASVLVEAHREFEQARQAANAAFSLVKLAPDFVIDRGSAGAIVGVGRCSSRQSGPLGEAWARWLTLWGLIYSGRDRTPLGAELKEETIAECAMTIGCMYGKSYVLSSDLSKLDDAFRWLAKSRRHWQEAAHLPRSVGTARDAFNPGCAIRFVKNVVRELGFMVQGGRIGAGFDEVLSEVRRVLPGGAASDHGPLDCACLRLPCTHSRRYRIDVGPFASCELSSKEQRDLTKDAVPTLQLAAHFVDAIRRSLTTDTSTADGKTFMADEGEWPHLTARLPATIYDSADCIEDARLSDLIVADCCNPRHKFMRLSIAALRILWATELEKTAPPAAPRPPRVHPMKRLLYRRSVEDLIANLSATILSGRGMIALYVCADASDDRRGCHMGRQSSEDPSTILTLEDLDPFFRRPLFLVIDSAAGPNFCDGFASPSRKRFGKAAVVLAPWQVPAALDAVLQPRGGTWLSYFLHAPAQAFWALHCLTSTVDLEAVDRAMQVLEHLVTRHAERFASDLQHFLRDPFARRLLVRFIFFQHYAVQGVPGIEARAESSVGIAALQDCDVDAVPIEVLADVGLAAQVGRLRDTDRRAGKRRRIDPS